MSVRKTWPAGQLIQSVTSVTLVSNTAKTIDVEVPTGEEWLLQSCKMFNDDNVTRACNIRRFKEAAKTNEVSLLSNGAVPADGRNQWPNNDDLAFTDSNVFHPVRMIAANTLEFEWEAGGASTGATDADGLVVEYGRIGV